MIKNIALTLLLCSSFVSAEEKPFQVGAYFGSWSQFREGLNYRTPFDLQKVDPEVLTDLYFAFGIFGYIPKDFPNEKPGLTGNYQMHALNPKDEALVFPRLQELKKQSKGQIRIFLSIGGSHFNDPNDPYGIGALTYPLFSRMIANETSRSEFIASAVSYTRKFGFDGIDLDWEYPASLTRGGDEDDFTYLVLFLKQFSEALKADEPPLLLSFAIPATLPEGVPKSFEENPKSYFEKFADCAPYLDQMVLMSYDYYLPLAEKGITGVNAPLSRDNNPKSSLYVVESIQLYLNAGVPAEKLLLGIPLYGWSYQGVENLTKEDVAPGKPYHDSVSKQQDRFISYHEIADLIAEKKLEFATDPVTQTAIAYNLPEKRWVTFDTPQTVELKVAEAKKRGLGGVVFWSLDLDEYEWGNKFPNIRTAH